MRPTVRSRRLGLRLSAARLERGLSGAAVAAELGLGQPHLSKIENGRAKISPDQLRRAATILTIPTDEAAQLEELRRQADKPGWWQDYGDLLSEPVEMLIELEAGATWIRTYDGPILPGLLQTPDYAERLITASSPHLRHGDIAQYLELRAKRQQRITDGLRLTAIISEAAIHQQIGGPTTLKNQLHHIIHTIHTHNVTCQIIPFTTDAHPATGDQFVIIHWPHNTTAVFVDGQTSWAVHEKPTLTNRYDRIHTTLQTLALTPQQSLTLLTTTHHNLTHQ